MDLRGHLITLLAPLFKSGVIITVSLNKPGVPTEPELTYRWTT